MTHFNIQLGQMETNLLTKREKANELKISYRTLDRRIKRGRLDSIKIPGKAQKWFLPEEAKTREF